MNKTFKLLSACLVVSALCGDSLFASGANVVDLEDNVYESLSAIYSEQDLIGANAATSSFFSTDDYYTPKMFGAKGDGKTDDTNALRKAIYNSCKDGKILFIPSGVNYKVTGTLNYYNKEYQNYTLNIVGCVPFKKGSYAPEEYGGISVSDNVSLFKDATIKGSMQNVCITGKRSDKVRFFDTCTCSGLVIRGCNISNFGAMFFDTSVDKVSQIIGNTFLTVFYFARNDKKGAALTDSMISYNYINGGMEKNDNVCFEWSYYNGVLITNNFIDYYQTIYSPRAIKKQTFVGPNSFNNEYQVFRYFYDEGVNISNITFTSYNDSFNWMEPSSLDKLKSYKVRTYKGKDNKTYEYPPYIAMNGGPWNITIKGAKIERNVKSMVFINSSTTEYEGAVFDVEVVGNNTYADGQINYKQGADKPLYNSGSYKSNKINIEGIIEKVDKLPSFATGWSAVPNGIKVQYNGKTCTATNVHSGGKWTSVWVDEKGNTVK